MTANDVRRSAPAALRNRYPIWSVLGPELPPSGMVLEIASGTGEHCTYFASKSRSDLIFQPSDPDPTARDSVDAWTRELELQNVRAALALDASSEAWPITHADVVVCINMIHISPWTATVGLIRGAARILPPIGLLYLYGPYRRGGLHTAPSNAAFDADLKSRNPAWGVRDAEAVAALAAEHGFGPSTIIDMPANNLSVLFRRS